MPASSGPGKTMTPLPRPGSTAGQSSRYNNNFVMVVRLHAEGAAALTWGKGVPEAYLVDAGPDLYGAVLNLDVDGGRSGRLTRPDDAVQGL